MREAHHASGPGRGPAELGELGRLIAVWQDSQRFRPSQEEMAKELRVSKQLVSNWMRGNYKQSLKPIDVERVAKMIMPADGSLEEWRMAVLNAMLRDTGHLPKGRLVPGPARVSDS